MNTGFLGPAVATVLTVYGIETFSISLILRNLFLLQQYLPFTVLKPTLVISSGDLIFKSCNSTYRLRY